MAFPGILSIALFMLVSRSLFIPCEAIPVDEVDPDVCQSDACQESAQYILESMDTSVDPCENFYQYACGGWIDKHPIPEGKKSYSTFMALRGEVNDNITAILKNAVNENHTEAVLNAAILFQGCIDEEAREAKGLNPLKNVLNSFGGWPMINPEWSDDGFEWYTQVATIRRALGVEALIAVRLGRLHQESTYYTITLGAPRFGLSAYYLKDLNSSETNRKIITAYRNYIVSVAKLMNPKINETQIINDADEIIQFESDLLQANYSVGRQRTLSGWYEGMMEYILIKIKGRHGGTAIYEVQKITENTYFRWTDFLNNVFQESAKITDQIKIGICEDLIYIRHALKLAHDTEPRIVANYIGWTLVRKIGQHTTKDFKEINSRFEQLLKKLEQKEKKKEKEDDVENEGKGEEEEIPKKSEKLETVCVDETTKLLGFAVGRLYVDNYFPEKAKHDVEKLIEDIRSAYELTFIHNDWMDPETKSKALEKLRSMINLVAYPDWIKNDDKLNDYYRSVQGLKKDEFFESWVIAQGAAEAKNLMKWNETIDRAIEWSDAPSVVNAFYSQSSNTIIFPAGIINPPIYKYGRLSALNHAGIGSVVAHEISHGFDDDGSRFNKVGKYRDWWSEETRAKFENKTECFKQQYSNIVEPISNMSLDGYNTLGDNIADNGGIRNAFMAYKLEVLQSEDNEVGGPKRLPGLSATPEQLFFLGFATVFCSRETKESMRHTIEKDKHSPEQYRINVPVSNSRAFAEAFNCPLGSPMNPETKCHLW